ncbi:hypothetical protein EV649_8112 [Kribbella sp. VKM Ac-2569]|uniref:hypothetical protein n=1 Tax=Kribbella sp. VKM Ac-2569 TaxID=2512220 RepID=UPI00102C59E9|nr:hypothetical protein [Kribbella sp. VKM Ac-2569]RZT07405.1 hypothetical protein EV649_8112 [Kribbella sp. VKM Ac-2569]
MTTDPAFRVEVLLSFQRALWDLVTPNLRAVAVRPTYPRIEARFLYETVGREEHLLVSEVVRMWSLTSYRRLMSGSRLWVVPGVQSRELLAGEEWVYRRHEDEPM